jgi:putative transposase
METVKQFSGIWPHAPEHRLYEPGTYMVTCGTYKKEPHLNSDVRRDDFLALLFKLAEKFEWRLQAWAILRNHYHFVGFSPPEGAPNAQSLRTLVSELHRQSSRRWNREDQMMGRKVWHNYWDSQITYQQSFYARLKYVHNNPVHHGLVDNAASYRWCSRAWVKKNGTPSFLKTMDSFRIDRVNVTDDF